MLFYSVSFFLYIYFTMAIKVYNITNPSQDVDEKYAFQCCRPSILGNPFTHIKDKKTLASFVVKDREEAISRYDAYFDKMYKTNIQFKRSVDALYYLYKTGKPLYLGCFCYPQSCHCDIIKKKLEERLIKEKLQTICHEKD